MSTVISRIWPAPLPRQEAPARRDGRFPSWWRDRHGWLGLAIYVAVSLFYDHHAVAHLGSVCACSVGDDPTQWMWGFVWIPHAILHGIDPLWTHAIWVPTGVDLASVADAPLTAIVGSPLTWLFGPIVAYNVIAIALPAVSGWAAYRLCRYVSQAPWASMLAGYTYGFSAYMFGHALGHLNLMCVFVPPLLVLVVLEFIDGLISRRRLTTYVALLVILQFGLENEIMFTMTCLGIVALVVGYLASGPEMRPRILDAARAIFLGYVIVAIVCSYYIWESTRVPAYAKGVGKKYPADLLSYFFPTRTFVVGANRFAALSSQFSMSKPVTAAAEQNNYLGIPLIALLLAYGFRTWEKRATKVVVITGLVAFIFSLGSSLTIAGHRTFAMPYSWVANLPLVNLILPSRLGLYVALAAAVAMAVWIPAARSRRGHAWRWLLGALAVAFLLPNLGLPRREVTLNQPAFFRTPAIYKKYLKRDEVVLPIPFAGRRGDLSMLWQAQTHMYFRMASGDWQPIMPSYRPYRAVGALLHNNPTAQTPRQLRTFTASHDVTAILLVVGHEGPWPAVLVKAGFKQVVTVGGIHVYKPS